MNALWMSRLLTQFQCKLEYREWNNGIESRFCISLYSVLSCYVILLLTNIPTCEKLFLSP